MPKFGWKAIYEDSIIKQYPFGKPEVLYNEVRTKGLPVKFFVGRRYGVNLDTGELLIRGKWEQFGNEDGIGLKIIALVYFRRNRVDVTPGVGGVHQVWHFVGFIHTKGMIRLCIPDNGDRHIICVGDCYIDEGHLVRRKQND